MQVSSGIGTTASRSSPWSAECTSVLLARVCRTIRFYQCLTNFWFFALQVPSPEDVECAADSNSSCHYKHRDYNRNWPRNILAYMQVSRKCERLVRAMAPAGNLFLLLSIQELRRRGLTFLAFYILQRTIDEREFSEFWVRQETGLDDYEVSRACTFLAQSGLIQKKKDEADARVRVLTPTDRGVRVRDKILSTAAERLDDGLPRPGRLRRVFEATQFFRKGNRILLEPLQLSFFDTDLCEEEPSKSVKRKGKARKPAKGRPRRSEP